MKTIEIAMPDNCKPSLLGFVTALMEKTHEFTSEEIGIAVGNNSVDAKSVLGLMTLRFDNVSFIKLTIIGEMEDYAAQKLSRFVKKLLELYVVD